MGNAIAEQLRLLANQIEAETPAGKGEPMPRSDNPRQQMVLTPDGKFFAEPFWMIGYLGAVKGVALLDWAQRNGMCIFDRREFPHLSVLTVDLHELSPADLGWMDASWYRPEDYSDADSRYAAWVKAGRPTISKVGYFDVRGDYLPANAWRDAMARSGADKQPSLPNRNEHSIMG